MKILSILKALEKQILNFSRSALSHMETRVSLKYFMNGCRFQCYQTVSQRMLERLRDL